MTVEKEKFSNQYKGVYLPFFKLYNEAIFKWLKDITLCRPEAGRPDIKVVYATPERAYAQFIAPSVEGQTDVPILSYYMSGMVFQQQRLFLPPFVPFYKRKVEDKWHIVPKATPWDISFNISFLGKFYEDADAVNWQLLSRFIPHSYIDVNGIKVCLKLESANDSSDIEPGTKDRVIRRDYTVNAEGWLQLPYKEVGSIQGVILKVNEIFITETAEGFNDIGEYLFCDDENPPTDQNANGGTGVVSVNTYEVDQS